MKTLATCLYFIFALALTACAPTDSGRATGQVIDDASLTTRVKTEIGQSLGVKEAAVINVDTYRGVVSLAGFVDSNEKRSAAATAARGVAGVKDVRNNLEIKPKQ